MKIILLRHGSVNLPAWPRIAAHELGRWISAYNAAGIKDTAPPAVLAAAGRCNVLVTSNLLRSVESGAILAPGRPTLPDPVFREAGLPYGALPFIKLPPAAWAMLFRLFWAFGYEANGEPESVFQARTRQAAERLIVLAHEHGSVLFAGHGLINAYLARYLLSEGWSGPRRPGVRHWACTEYTKGKDDRHDLR